MYLKNRIDFVRRARFTLGFQCIAEKTRKKVSMSMSLGFIFRHYCAAWLSIFVLVFFFVLLVTWFSFDEIFCRKFLSAMMTIMMMKTWTSSIWTGSFHCVRCNGNEAMKKKNVYSNYCQYSTKSQCSLA